MGGKDKSQAKKTALPKNWPAHIRYLTAPLYAPHLTPAHLRAIRTPTSDPSDPLPEIPRDLKPGPCPAVRITPITDPNHPAHGQAGLFATRDLRPGELILPYLGEVHVGSPAPAPAPAPSSSSSSSPDSYDYDYDYAQSDYDLWLDRDADVAVDAARAGNEARFVNDYRGVPVPVPVSLPGRGRGRGRQEQPQTQRGPNAEFRVCWDARSGERCMAVFVLPAGKRDAGRRGWGIKKGEEVLVSYGRGFWMGRREGGGGEVVVDANGGG
ncbi:hypothetical protein VTK56DRAFT_9075 [Thermocarpiscus australiensis]